MPDRRTPAKRKDGDEEKSEDYNDDDEECALTLANPSNVEFSEISKRPLSLPRSLFEFYHSFDFYVDTCDANILLSIPEQCMFVLSSFTAE